MGIVLFVHKFSFAVVCFPVIFISLILLSLGISWFVASLGVFVRDLALVIGILLQVLYFMTPIFYSVEMVPESFRGVLLLNPLTFLVQFVRQVLIYNQWPDWHVLGVSIFCSAVIFQLGYFWFMKTKRGFADVL